MVMDELMWKLNDNEHYIIGYVDDFVIINNGTFLQTVAEVLQTEM
jgi:hypothetical protein